jgi:hypothetical protein
MNGSRFHSFPRILVIGAFLLASGTYDRFAAGTTLQELFNGGSIVAGDSQFSDFEMISLDSTAAVTPDLSQIDVVPLVSDLSNPGLQFSANGQLQISGVEAIDLVFKFRVDALAGINTFTNHALTLDGIRFGGTGGLASITDEVEASAECPRRNTTRVPPTRHLRAGERNMKKKRSLAVKCGQATAYVALTVERETGGPLPRR